MNIKKYINLATEQKCSVVLETKTIDVLRQSIKWIEGQ